MSLIAFSGDLGWTHPLLSPVLRSCWTSVTLWSIVRWRRKKQSTAAINIKVIFQNPFFSTPNCQRKLIVMCVCEFISVYQGWDVTKQQIFFTLQEWTEHPYKNNFNRPVWTMFLHNSACNSVLSFVTSFGLYLSKLLDKAKVVNNLFISVLFTASMSIWDSLQKCD